MDKIFLMDLLQNSFETKRMRAWSVWSRISWSHCSRISYLTEKEEGKDKVDTLDIKIVGQWRFAGFSREPSIEDFRRITPPKVKYLKI